MINKTLTFTIKDEFNHTTTEIDSMAKQTAEELWWELNDSYSSYNVQLESFNYACTEYKYVMTLVPKGEL